MKIVHIYGHEPMFEPNADERAILIAALSEFFNSNRFDETAKRMLNDIWAIDDAVRAILALKKGGTKKCDMI